MKGNKTYEKNKNSLKDSSVKYTEQKFQNTQNEKQAKYLEGIPSDIELRLRTEYNLDLNRTTDSIIAILLLSSFIQASQLNKSENNKGNKNIDWKAISNTLNDVSQKPQIDHSLGLIKQEVNQFINIDKNNEPKLSRLLENAKIIGGNIFEKVDGFLSSLVTLGIKVVAARTVGENKLDNFYDQVAKIQSGKNITIFPNIANKGLPPMNITLQQATENLMWGDHYNLFDQYFLLRSLLSSPEKKITSFTRDVEVETALNRILEIENKLLSDKDYQSIWDPNATDHKEFINRNSTIKANDTISAVNSLRQELLKICDIILSPDHFIPGVSSTIPGSPKEVDFVFFDKNPKIKNMFETASKDIFDVVNKNITSSNKILKGLKNNSGTTFTTPSTFCDDSNSPFSKEFDQAVKLIKKANDTKNDMLDSLLEEHPAIKQGIILTKKISDPSFNITKDIKVIDDLLKEVADLFAKYKIPTQYIKNETEGGKLTTNSTHVVTKNEFLPYDNSSSGQYDLISNSYIKYNTNSSSTMAKSMPDILIFHENLHRFFNHLREYTYINGTYHGSDYSGVANYKIFNPEIIANATWTLANFLDGKIDIDSATDLITHPRFTTPSKYDTILNSAMSYIDQKLNLKASTMDEAVLMMIGFLNDEVKNMKEILQDPIKLKNFNLTAWDEKTIKEWKNKGFNLTAENEENQKRKDDLTSENIEKIIGGVIGTLCTAAMALAVYYCCYRKKTKEEDKEVVVDDKKNGNLEMVSKNESSIKNPHNSREDNKEEIINIIDLKYVKEQKVDIISKSVSSKLENDPGSDIEDPKANPLSSSKKNNENNK